MELEAAFTGQVRNGLGCDRIWAESEADTAFYADQIPVARCSLLPPTDYLCWPYFPPTAESLCSEAGTFQKRLLVCSLSMFSLPSALKCCFRESFSMQRLK